MSNISFKLSGLPLDGSYPTKDITWCGDTKIKCNYIYMSSDAADSLEQKTYKEVLQKNRSIYPFFINYENDREYNITQDGGIYINDTHSNSYSIYRREYEVYNRLVRNSSGNLEKETEVYAGQWKPVAINISTSAVRDFNITSDRAYQYILYPNYIANKQQYALKVDSNIKLEDSNLQGDIFKTHWEEWSLAELIPQPNDTDAPILNKTYKVDINNIWLFKYNLNAGAQTQNLSKNEISTLGQYPKIGYGIKNYVSGDVSCFLGSEIVPYTSEGYIERLRNSINTPLSTNERTRMLNQWRNIAYSKNPKLLKDNKGQSWIVQIFSSSNTPHTFIKNQPDEISFSWKQIESTENCVIYGSGEVLPEKGECGSVWTTKDFVNINGEWYAK